MNDYDKVRADLRVPGVRIEKRRPSWMVSACNMLRRFGLFHYYVSDAVVNRLESNGLIDCDGNPTEQGRRPDGD